MMSAEQLHATRAEQRRLRLAEVEREQAEEEAEALTMTEEQRQILLRPFLSVKAEFTDLDGLRWSDQETIRVPAAPPRPRPKMPVGHRDGSRTRSPVKGLFPNNPSPPPLYTDGNLAESSLLYAPPRLHTARSMSLLPPPATTAPLPRRRRAATTTARQAPGQAPMAADSLGSLLETPLSTADPAPSARARLAALLTHAPAPPPPPRRAARSPPLSPALPALITTLSRPPDRPPVVSPGDSSTIRPPARRARPALPPQVPPPPGLRGWRSADVEEEGEADGYTDDDEAEGPSMREARAYASGVPAWESDAEDEETPRPSPVEGDVSPSRRWIRGFA